MDHEAGHSEPDRSTPEPDEAYRPPQLTYLGTLAELTQQQKEPGASDGRTFLGIQIGS